MQGLGNAIYDGDALRPSRRPAYNSSLFDYHIRMSIPVASLDIVENADGPAYGCKGVQAHWPGRWARWHRFWATRNRSARTTATPERVWNAMHAGTPARERGRNGVGKKYEVARSALWERRRRRICSRRVLGRFGTELEETDAADEAEARCSSGWRTTRSRCCTTITGAFGRSRRGGYLMTTRVYLLTWAPRARYVFRT